MVTGVGVASVLARAAVLKVLVGALVEKVWAPGLLASPEEEDCSFFCTLMIAVEVLIGITGLGLDREGEVVASSLLSILVRGIAPGGSLDVLVAFNKGGCSPSRVVGVRTLVRGTPLRSCVATSSGAAAANGEGMGTEKVDWEAVREGEA